MDTDPDQDARLSDEITRLRDAQPATDLWPAISRQLEPRGGRRGFQAGWKVALAAGVLIAVTTSVVTVILLRRSEGPPAVATTPGSPSESTTATSASLSAAFAPGDAALARAVSDLENAVRRNLPRLDAEARSSINQSLTALDAAIAQAAQRQLAAPDDPGVARFLTSTLRKKLQLLRTVSQLTQPS